MSDLIPDEGSKSARLVLVGEAGGQHEAAQHRPFVGPAGMKLRDWWGEVGLQRSHFYITNTYPYRPPNNKLHLVPPDDVRAWMEDLHERIAALDDPWLIAPTGNAALFALTCPPNTFPERSGKWITRGSGPNKAINWPCSITRQRGSIYAYTDRKGRSIKCIPTIHPAAVFRQSTWEGRCRADWHRISRDADVRDLGLPERNHYIQPTLDDIHAYLEDAARRAEILAVDIETPRERTLRRTVTARGKERFKYELGDPRITCVGFSYEPSISLTVPTTLAYWGSQEFLDEAWSLIRQLCALNVWHGGQNFLFDRWWLLQREYNCPVANATFDTRWMDHCLNPLDDHDLAYQASLWTREPYWKDDGKGTDEFEGDPADLATFLRYNGKDAAVTRELMGVHYERLVESGKQRVYDGLYVPMFEPMLRTMLHGVRVNTKAQRVKHMQLTAECIAIQQELQQITGEVLYGKKDLSRVALQRYLHETLRLPKVVDRKTKSVTVKEVAIRRLMLKFPDKLGRDGEEHMPGPLILRHRRQFKLATFIKEGVVDEDSRSRCSYGFVDTLRLNSGKNPKRSGNNHQNQDRDLLDLFIPDTGHVFVEVDLSQAESRVVYMLTRSPRLIERARLQPWENDDHRRAASIIFHKDMESIAPDERYIGKRCRHAGNYDMHGLKLSEELLKEGYTLTPEECEGYINAIIDTDTPEVRDWQRGVRMTILQDRALCNSWGYTVSFEGERFGDDLYRRAYAFVPQSEVTTIINQWGWVPLHQWIEYQNVDIQVAWQKHDSLLISTPPEYAWDVATFLHQSLDRPRVYCGKRLTIPVTLKLGTTGKLEREFKRWPEREEFEEALKCLK